MLRVVLVAAAAVVAVLVATSAPAVAAAAAVPCPYPAPSAAPAPVWSLSCASPSLSGGGMLLSPSPHSGAGSLLRVQGAALGHAGLDLLSAADNPAGGAMPGPINAATGHSLLLWVFLRSYASTAGAVFFERASADGSRFWRLLQLDAGVAGFAWTRDSAPACTIPAPAVQAQRWVALGLTLDPAGALVAYVDGSPVASCVWPALDAWTAARAVLPASPVADGWDVDVAHVDWWDGALSGAAMAALVAAPPSSVSYRAQAVAGALYHHPFLAKLEGAPWFPAAHGGGSDVGGVAAVAHYAHAIYHSLAVDSTAAGANAVLPVAWIDPPLTISGWIFLLSRDTYPDLLELRYAWREHNVTYNRDRLNIYIGHTGHISLVASWNTSEPVYYADNSVLDLYVWHHVAVSISAASPSTLLRFWHNGRLTASTLVSDPLIRYGIERNQAYTSNADGPPGQAHDDLRGTGIRMAQLVVHAAVLDATHIRQLAISPPVSIVPSPLTIQIPSSAAPASLISVPVYLPWIVPEFFPLCNAPAWTISIAAVTSSGDAVAVSPATIVFDSVTTAGSFSLSFPASLSVQWIDVSFSLHGLTSYVTLPFISWRILQRSARVLRSSALVDTQFATDPVSPHYSWATGPSGAPNTGVALFADYGQYADLRSIADLPGSAGTVPLEWGSSRPWHGHTISTWLQWNGPWCQSVCGSAEIDLLVCQAADQSELVHTFVASGDTENAPGLKYAGRFLPPPAPKHYASSHTLRLTGEWVHIVVTTSAHGQSAFYVNGTLQGPASANSQGFVRVASRSQCTLRTHGLGGSAAAVSFWDRALTDAEVAVVAAAGRPLSICFAPCIYASAMWGSFFDTAAAFAGHTLNPADPTPTSGYLAFRTQIDPRAAANGGLNVPFELSLRDALNFRHPGELPLSDAFDSLATDAMEVLTLSLWVRFMDAAPAVLFDWRAAGGADAIKLERVAGGGLQYSAQVGVAPAVSFAIPATVVVGQWLHACVIHNRTALTVYANTVAYAGPPMPLVRRVSRPLASLHDTGLVHVAALHVFPVALVRREVETVFSWKPDSIFRPPITLLCEQAHSPCPSSIAPGQTITIVAALPLPWAIFPAGSPTSLTLLLDDCGTGSVSPSTLVFAGAATASFTVRIPPGLARVTIKYALAAGEASARYSAPTTSVFVPATGRALWDLAQFGTFFPAAPTSAAAPAWTAGLSADSGIVSFAAPSQSLRLDLAGDVGTATAPQPLTLPVELGRGLSVAVSALLSSGGVDSGVFWQLSNVNATHTLSFQIRDAEPQGIELRFGPVASPRRCTAVATLPSGVYAHFALTVSAASVASLFIDGTLAARCNFPFVADLGWVAASAGSFGQSARMASLHYFAVELNEAEVALLALQSAPSLLAVASASAAALRATADFGTTYDAQLSFAGWAPGPSNVPGTGIALTASSENGLSYIAFNVEESAAKDLGVGAPQWPVSFGARPGGFSVSSWHLLQRYSGYPQPWSCRAVGGADAYHLRVQFDAAAHPNKIVVAWSTDAPLSTVYEISPVVPLVLGQWMHITLVLSPCDLAGEPNVFVYFNGALLFSFNVPDSVPVANRACSTRDFTDAAQAGMHVWQRMLSPSEVDRLSRTPPPNISPCALTVALDSMPSSMDAGEVTTVDVVLPLPLYMFAAASAGAVPAVVNQYAFNVLRSDGSLISTFDFALSDASPTASLVLSMPAAGVVSDFVSVWLELRSGDLAHYISSRHTVYLRSAANIYAQATFQSWFQAAVVASADLQQSPPPASHVMLQNYYKMSWLNADETGATGVYPSVIGSAGFPAGPTDVGGFTIAVRFVGPTTVAGGCWSDLLNAGVSSGPLSRINVFRDELARGFCLKISESTLVGNRTGSPNGYCCYNPGPVDQLLVAGQQYHVVATQTRYNKVKLYLDGALVKECEWLPAGLSVPRAEIMSQAQCAPIHYYSHHYWPRSLSGAEVAAAHAVTRYGVISLSASFPAQIRAGDATPLTITLSGQVLVADLQLLLQCTTFPAGGSIVDFSAPSASFPASTTGGQVTVMLTGNLASAPQGAHCSFSFVIDPASESPFYDLPPALAIEVLPVPQGLCASDDGHWTGSVPNQGAPYCAVASTTTPTPLDLRNKDWSFAMWFQVKFMAPSSLRQVLLTIGEDDAVAANQFMFVSLTPTVTSGFASLTWDWNGWQNFAVSPAVRVLDRWVHLVGVVRSVATHAGAAQQAIFFDGQPPLTQGISVDLAVAGPHTVFLGSYICGHAWGVVDPLAGAIDEVRLWSRALSEPEVQAGFLTNAWPSLNLELWFPFSDAAEIGGGMARDASGFERHAHWPADIAVGNYELADGACTTITSQCPVSTRSDGHVLLSGGSNCAQIDTTGTELQLAHTDFTISFFVRRTQLAGGVTSTLLSYGNAPSSELGYLQVGYTGAIESDRLWLSFGAIKDGRLVSSSLDLTVHDWVLLTLVVRSVAQHGAGGASGASRVLYRNGVAWIDDQRMVDDLQAVGVLSIGAATAPGANCVGGIVAPHAIDELRIYDRALTVAEVLAQWRSHPVAAGLVLHYPFTANTGTPLILADDRAHASSSALSATWLTQPSYGLAHPLCVPARFDVVGTVESLIVGSTPTLHIAPSVVLPAGIGVQIAVGTLPPSGYTALFELQFAPGAPGLVSQPITLLVIPAAVTVVITLVPTGFLSYQLDSNSVTLPTRDASPAAVLTVSVAPGVIYPSQFSVVSASFATPFAWVSPAAADALVVVVSVSAGTMLSSDRMTFRSSLDSRSLLWIPPSTTTPQVVTFTFATASPNPLYALSTTTATVDVRPLIGSPMCAAVGVNGQLRVDRAAIVAPNCLNRTSAPALSLIRQDFTFSYWMFLRALPPPGSTVFAFTLGAESSSHMLQSAWVRQGSDVAGGLYFFSPEDRATATLRTPALGRWTFVVGTHESPSLHANVGSTRLYIDGDLRLWHRPVLELAANGSLVVGCYSDCTRCITGSIDELRFYGGDGVGSAWSMSDVAAALNAGTFSSTHLLSFFSFPFTAGAAEITDEAAAAAAAYPLVGADSPGIGWDGIDGVCGSVPISPVLLDSCTPAAGSSVYIAQQIVCVFHPSAPIPVSSLSLLAQVGGDAGGSVSPASRTWDTSSAALSPQSYLVTVAAPAGVLSLDLTIAGGVAPLFAAPIDTLTWTVADSTIMTVSCSPPTSGSLYALQSSVCWLSPNASPLGGALNVSLVAVSGGGSVSPAYLVFPVGDGAMRSFNFSAPLASGPVSVALTAGGSAGPQFTTPPHAAWTVIPRDTISVLCVGDGILAWGETVSCTIALGAAPDAPISLLPSIVSGTGSLSAASLAWVALSVTPQSFQLTAPGSSGSAVVGFEVQGAGGAQFEPPAAIAWTIQPPTVLSVSCTPAATLVFSQLSQCWLQPIANVAPDAGPLQINLTAVGGGLVVPASLTFLTGAALPFNYTAPTTAGPVSVAFSEGGSAASQYSLPASGASWTVLESAEAFVLDALPVVWYPNQTIVLSISLTVPVPTGRNVTLSFVSSSLSALFPVSASLTWLDTDVTLSRQLVVQAPLVGSVLQWNASSSGSAMDLFSLSAISPFSFTLSPRASFTITPNPAPSNVRPGEAIVLALTPTMAPAFSAALVSVTCAPELSASQAALSFPLALLTSRSLTLTPTINGTFECSFDSASFSAQFLPVPVWTVTVLPPAPPPPPQCSFPSANSSTPCSSLARCVEQPSVQYQRNFTCECPLGTGGFDCRLTPAAHGPTAVLLAPAQVAACDWIVLDARASLGLSAAGMARFGAASLRLSGVEQLDSYASSIGAYSFSPSGVAVLNATTLGGGVFSFGGRVLSVPASALPSDSVVEFWLQVVEPGAGAPPLGVWSVPALARVTRIDSTSSPWMPNHVSISKPAAATMRRTTSATFSPDMVPACARLPNDAVMSFRWIVAPFVAAADWSATEPTGPVHTASSRDLVIPANTLQAMSRYTIWLRLTVASSSGIAGRRRLLATSDTLVRYTDISVVASTLVASIAGGSRSRVGNAPVLLDGSASMDPDTGDASALTFSWVCACTTDPLLSCTLPLALSSSPSLQLPAGFFPPGQRYLISLQVSGSGGRVSPVDSIELTIHAPTATPAPLVSIHNAVDAANPNDAVVLQGRAVSTTSTPAYALQSVWTVTSAQAFDCSAQSNLLGPANAINLLLASNVLAPGVWTFRLTVTDPLNAQSAFAETSLTVRSPPSGGSCDLSPSTGGVALTDLFTLVCTGWSDSALLLPLVYSSVLVAADGSEQLLHPSSALPFSSFLLAAGTLTVKTYITNAEGASASVSQTVVVVPAAAMVADPVCFALARSNTLLADAIAQQDVSLVLTLTSQLADLLAMATTAAATSNSACSAADVGDLLVASLSAVAPLASSCETKRLVAQSLESVSANPALTPTSANEVRALLSAAIAGLCADEAQAAALGDALSNLLSCSTLDSILALTLQLLSQGLTGGVSGHSLSLDTLHFFALSSRADVHAGITVALPDSNINAAISPTAMAELAQAMPALTAANVDAAISAPSGHLDSRVVSFGPAFAACHPTGSQLGLLGPPVSIDFMLNGVPLNISSLLGPFSFVLPGDLLSGSSCAVAECGWWDPAANEWSTAGCAMVGATSDGLGAQCSCTHTTEFALLARTNTACESDVGWQWLLFLILYSTLGFVALVQLCRIVRASGCSNWLMSSEHALIVCICAARAVNQALFYGLMPQLSFTGMALLAGLPYLFLSWIFSAVIVAWASLSAQAKDGGSSSNPFARYQYRFIAGNIIVCATLFSLFVAMTVSSSPERVRLLSHIGEMIVVLLCVALAAFFALYGSKLVRALTKDFKSPHAFKLGATAVSLSVAFLTSGLLLLYGVTNEAGYEARFDLLNSLYFAMDLVGLTIILLLFRKSVNDAEARDAQAADKPGGSRFFVKSNRSVLTRQTILTTNQVSVHHHEPAKPDDDSSSSASSSDSDSDRDDQEHSSAQRGERGASALPVVSAAAAASAASAIIAAASPPAVLSESGAEDHSGVDAALEPAPSVPVPTAAEAAAAAAAAALLAHQWLMVDDLQHHPEYKSGPAFSFKRTAAAASAATLQGQAGRARQTDKWRAARAQMHQHLQRSLQGDADLEAGGQAPPSIDDRGTDIAIGDTIQLPHSTEPVCIHTGEASSSSSSSLPISSPVSVPAVATAADSPSFDALPSPSATDSATAPFASPSMVALSSPSSRASAAAAHGPRPGRQRSYLQLQRSPSRANTFASIDESATSSDHAPFSPLILPAAAGCIDADVLSAPAPLLGSPSSVSHSRSRREVASGAIAGLAIGTGSGGSIASSQPPPSPSGSGPAATAAASGAVRKPLYVRIHSNQSRLTGSPPTAVPLRSPSSPLALARAPSGSPPRRPPSTAMHRHTPANDASVAAAGGTSAAAAAAASSSSGSMRTRGAPSRGRPDVAGPAGLAGSLGPAHVAGEIAAAQSGPAVAVASSTTAIVQQQSHQHHRD